jgi:hypothetical protein
MLHRLSQASDRRSRPPQLPAHDMLSRRRHRGSGLMAPHERGRRSPPSGPGLRPRPGQRSVTDRSERAVRAAIRRPARLGPPPIAPVGHVDRSRNVATAPRLERRRRSRLSRTADAELGSLASDRFEACVRSMRKLQWRRPLTAELLLQPMKLRTGAGVSGESPATRPPIRLGRNHEGPAVERATEPPADDGGSSEASQPLGYQSGSGSASSSMNDQVADSARPVPAARQPWSCRGDDADTGQAGRSILKGQLWSTIPDLPRHGLRRRFNQPASCLRAGVRHVRLTSTACRSCCTSG